VTGAGSMPTSEPATGEITAEIKERSLRDGTWTLRYRLSIPGAFAVSGMPPADEVSAHGIDFGIRSWEELAGRAFGFPTDPVRIDHTDGEAIPAYAITGAVRFGEQYDTLRVGRISFDTIANGVMPVHVFGFIVFDPSCSASPPQPIDAHGIVRIGPVHVFSPRTSEPLPLAEAARLAAEFLDLEKYHEPRSAAGFFYDPRL